MPQLPLRLKSPITSLVGFALLILLGLVPVAATVLDDPFMLTLFTRVVIMAIAAVSLNLILGYGGMVSFGHAAYIGIGGYAIGILAHHGINEAWIQWPVALIGSALSALLIGLLSLRTKGIFFIMLTLALAQLVYYLGNGAYAYGGDDGLTIQQRSSFGGLIDLNDKESLFYLCWVLLVLTLWLTYRIVNSRFGMVLQGAKSNDRRMATLGFPVFRYRLTAFVIAGTLCGLAGILTATYTDFISPAMMHWTRSGDLIVMVVLGGMGSLFGPLFGAFTFLMLEEILSSWTEYWKIVFGPILLLVVLFARGGIDGAMVRGAAGYALTGLVTLFAMYIVHYLWYDDWVPAAIVLAVAALAIVAIWLRQRRTGGQHG